MNAETDIGMIETILIVDDAPENLAVLSDMLSEAGYRVLVATDGLSALEQIGYLKPDLILLDVMMPGIDGFETCRALKSRPLTSNIPVIFMTGLSELDDLLRGFGEGAVDYIIKPIRPPEVLARVDAQLAHIRNLNRVEEAMSHLAFAALAFNAAGLMTWLTPAAVKILSESFPDTFRSEGEIRIEHPLPEAMLGQFRSWSKPPIDNGNAPSIRIGRHYSGKIIACNKIEEYLLLIQRCSQEWDLDSLKRSFGLTPREAEILMWIARGKTNKEVGLILETSPRTVNKHLEHVFEKLGVPTRTAAVAKVLHGNNNPS